MSNPDKGIIAMVAKWIPRFVDWLGLRLIALVLVAATVFAIVQPFVWRELFDEPAPGTASDLGAIMSMVVSILALALAGFGVTLAQLASRAERRVRDAAEAQLEQVRGEVATQRREIASAQANLFLALSFRSWDEYFRTWRADGYDAAALDAELVKAAISDAEKAIASFNDVEGVDADPRAKELLRRAKNDFAFHVATLKDRARSERALEYVKELEAEADVSESETIAWVNLAFGDRAAVRRWLDRVLNDSDTSDAAREDVTKRYKRRGYEISGRE